jgi:hypothetical protein
VDGDAVYAFSVEFGLKNLGSARRFCAPSLAVDYVPDCHNFYIAWTGADDYLNYDVLDANGPYQGLASPYEPAHQQNVAWAGTGQQPSVLAQRNGFRPSSDPVNVTSQTAPSLGANGDLYFASTHLNTQIQIIDQSKTAASDTREFSRVGPSRAIDAAGTRRMAWREMENRFSPFGKNLNYEDV